MIETAKDHLHRDLLQRLTQGLGHVDTEVSEHGMLNQPRSIPSWPPTGNAASTCGAKRLSLACASGVYHVCSGHRVPASTTASILPPKGLPLGSRSGWVLRRRASKVDPSASHSALKRARRPVGGAAGAAGGRSRCKASS